MLSCNPHKDYNIINTADDLLWENPDSCIAYIQATEKPATKYTQERLSLIKNHAYYKVTGTIENDSLLSEQIEYFTQEGEYRDAGEANYIIGASYVQQGKFFEATTYLKTAEKLLAKDWQQKPQLKGMLYLNLGIASEQCRLFDIASDYCKLAIPYLKEHNNPTYLAVCYNVLGKSNNEKKVQLMYLDSALYYAQNSKYQLYYDEIKVTRYKITNPQHYDTSIIGTIAYLCDSCFLFSYAALLANAYIENKNYAKAIEYIDKLSADTGINIWSREQYHVLQSELLYAQGEYKQAYHIIQNLHKRQTDDIENSAFASTYIISQKYDVAKEQELRLQEQVKKQRAYFWIIVVLMICICIGGYTYYIYKKGKLERQLNHEQKKRLEQELETNRAILRARISERIEIAKDLYLWNSHHNESMPDILGPLSPKQAASDLQNWKNFYTEFNLCYNNVLAKLKEEHPALTETDLQYIALTLLKYDITEMSFLLRIEKQTIWNRRTSVKRHLGMPDEANLNEWIINDMIKEYDIVEPQRIQPNTKKRRRKKEAAKKLLLL